MTEVISDQTQSIYRFKFSKNFLQHLHEFSRIHKYDDSKIFKEHWEQWTKDNHEIIDRESGRLKTSGYEGNVLTKMYKSSRYYFKNKSTEKVEPKKRRQYIGLERSFLDAIDSHIDNHINNNWKPSVFLNDFLDNDEYKEIIKKEKLRLQSYNLTDEDIAKKFKKTYKNRHFNKIKK